MSGETESQPDDPLEQATTALREIPVPQGPSTALRHRTVTRLRVADPASVLPIGSGAARGERTRKVLAMVLVAGTAAAVGVGVFLVRPFPLAPRSGQGLAVSFQEVLERVGQMSVVRYRYNETPTPQGFAYAQATEVVNVDADAVRIIPAQGESLELPVKAGQTLFVEPADEAGRPVTVSSTQPAASLADSLDLLGHLRRLDATSARFLGRRRIGGHDAEGFRIQDSRQEQSVWVDRQTRLPVLIERPAARPGDPERQLSDFVWKGLVGQAQKTKRIARQPVVYLNVAPRPDYKILIVPVDPGIDPMPTMTPPPEALILTIPPKGRPPPGEFQVPGTQPSRGSDLRFGGSGEDPVRSSPASP